MNFLLIAGFGKFGGGKEVENEGWFEMIVDTRERCATGDWSFAR